MGRKRNQGSKWIRKDKRLAIYMRDGLACAFCGASIESDDVVLTLDHLVPCEKGGTNHESNLITACLSCNSSKQDKTLREFYVVLRDRGIKTSKIGSRIRRHVKRSLKKYRVLAKVELKARK